MFAKLKYILFDFSDNFKNDFLGLLKKTAVFLIVGIIAMLLSDLIEPAGYVAGGCELIFGFLWGRNLIASFIDFSSISSNFIIKWAIVIFVFIIGIAFGYIYFLWCVIKMIVVLIKGAKTKGGE